MNLDNELAMFDLELESREEALCVLGNHLYEKGFVNEDFVKSVIERERNFPTGLPTEPFGVAIPHAEGDKVKASKIAFASLKKPVTFFAMGSSDDRIDVKLIFMLALKSPDDQLEMLQKLTSIFQDQIIVSRLGDVRNVDALNELIKEAE